MSPMRIPGRMTVRGLWPAAGLALLVACGGGGGASGTDPFPSGGSGTGGFGGGAGTPPFGGGAGGGGLVGDGPRPAPDPIVVVSNDAIQGSVIDSATGAGLSGAAVRFSGSSLTSDSQGLYSQANAAPAARMVIEGAATGFESLFGVTEVLGSVPAVNILRLTPLGTTATLTIASGGTVTQTGTPASVSVPANALVYAGGGATPATADVRVTAIDIGSDSNLLSGDFTDSGGTQVQAYGSVVLSSSPALDVVAGQPLTLQIPLSSRSALTPASATLYYLDTATGRWVADGTATLVSGAQPYYTAAVTRFAQWMVGTALTATQTVSGCVVDDAGAAAANVRIAADGINYSSIAYTTTTAQGQFTLQLPTSSRSAVQGRRGAFLTNATAVDVQSAPISLLTCLTIPTTNAATMRLTWGASPSDIDSHLRVPGGAHVYYASQGSLSAEPNASLDVDDVTGFGPEVTTIRKPKVGIYRFYLHNFSQTFAPGMTGSPTRVELNYVGRTVVFSPPSGEGSALWWHLFDLEVQADCSMVLYRYNRWRADEPQNPNPAGTATECVPS